MLARWKLSTRSVRSRQRKVVLTDGKGHCAKILVNANSPYSIALAATQDGACTESADENFERSKLRNDTKKRPGRVVLHVTLKAGSMTNSLTETANSSPRVSCAHPSFNLYTYGLAPTLAGHVAV